MDAIFTTDREHMEIIKDQDEIEKFQKKYLISKDLGGIYRLDGLNEVAYAGDKVIMGINDTVWKDEESYGRYLVEQFGYEIFRLPKVKE